MHNAYFEEKKFYKTDFTAVAFVKGDYENCGFMHCNFAGVDIGQVNFTDCLFTDCNFALALLNNTAFTECRFVGCKLLGLHFEDCNQMLFTVGFENCVLDLSSFYKLKMKSTAFTNSSLQEVDFTEADLTASVFENCNLARAIFDNTILQKVDLRSSYNYSIDPERNRLKKAKFSLAGVSGLLHKYDIDIE